MVPIIECEGFSFSYGAAVVLDNITFKLERGEWLTILGPNGSGKSTLLRNFLRLTEGGKRGGSLRIEDRPIDAWSQVELARKLAWVPQAGGRIPPFTVEDFVNLSRYPYSWRGLARQDTGSKSVEDALQLTETAQLAKRRMDELSGGQRQRVYLAAALAQDTDTLLLDEPASFLDPRHVHAMNELLKYLHTERGITIATVTHDLNQPFDAGGKALVIANGKQAFFGNASELEKNGMLDQAFQHRFSYLVHPVTHKTLVVA